MVNFIGDYENDEYEGTFESPQSKKRRGGMDRAEKGVDFYEALEKNMTGIK